MHEDVPEGDRVSSRFQTNQENVGFSFLSVVSGKLAKKASGVMLNEHLMPDNREFKPKLTRKSPDRNLFEPNVST